MSGQGPRPLLPQPSPQSPPYHVTWPIEKYSFSVSSITAPPGGQSEWAHHPHRDNLYLVFNTMKKFVPGNSTPADKVVAKVVWGLQTLEELDLSELLPRTFIGENAVQVPAVFVIGRAPCLAIKYIAPNQTLRRFQVRFRASADYEVAKTMFEAQNCPVRQRLPGNPLGSSTQVPDLNHDMYQSQIPTSQMFPAPQTLPRPQIQQTAMAPQVQMPQPNYFSTPNQPENSYATPHYQQPTQFPVQVHNSQHTQYGQSLAPPTHQRSIRPTPASAYDFPSDERPYTMVPTSELTPPNSAWGPTPKQPESSAPDLSDSYLDRELPPPRPPARFFGSSGCEEKTAPAKEVEPELTDDDLNLPPLKKPTPISKPKAQLPTPSKTPAAPKKRPAAPKKNTAKGSLKAPAGKRCGKESKKTPPPPPRATTSIKRPPAVEVVVSETESEAEDCPVSKPTRASAVSTASGSNPPSKKSTPALPKNKDKAAPKKRKRAADDVTEVVEAAAEEPVETVASTACLSPTPPIEQLIIDALNDDEFIKLCEAVGTVWQRIGLTDVGQGLFDI